ncbi:MAG: flavodoxin family protein [Firmicutes bacterium]|nr:flavodoxin family protein [Bacillota bacterium]
MKLYLINLFEENSRGRIKSVVDEAMEKEGLSLTDAVIINSTERLRWAAEAGLLRDVGIIFAVELDESGINLEAFRLIKYLNTCGNIMEGSAGGIIIDGTGDLATKDLARRLALAANMAGCTFPGKALVEATGSLQNFNILARTWNLTTMEAYKKSTQQLIAKVMNFQNPECSGQSYSGPSILMVHASSRKTSNSLRLWEEVSAYLEGRAEVEEISIRNGQVWDCRGCKYEECLHFGENSSCFYGGVMVEKVYPAIIKSDIVVLVCPNYNDSVSANIMAFINRLTAVFRTNDFSRKKVYALVISGYSGGDIVAQQIIGAMNMNKNFILPGNFAMIETANDPGAIMEIDNISEKARAFAENILKKEKME